MFKNMLAAVGLILPISVHAQTSTVIFDHHTYHFKMTRGNIWESPLTPGILDWNFSSGDHTFVVHMAGRSAFYGGVRDSQIPGMGTNAPASNLRCSYDPYNSFIGCKGTLDGHGTFDVMVRGQ